MHPKNRAQMMAYLTRKGIKKPFTPASAIQRPKKVLEIEAFQDFNKRNPKAGGGMLVQPGFGGTRQGYKEEARFKKEGLETRISNKVRDLIGKIEPINPKTGKRSGTRGNNRAKVISEVSKAIGKDATPETLTPEFIEDYLNIKDLKGKITPEKVIEKISEQIDRPPTLKFSKTSDRGMSYYEATKEPVSKLDNSSYIGKTKIEMWCIWLEAFFVL